MSGIGRSLIIIGCVIAGVGLLMTLAPKIPWLGRLPGDIFFRRGSLTIYLPLATSLLLSILLSLILWLLRR